MEDKPDKLLTMKEVAKMLNIGSWVLRNWIQAKQIPFYRLGYKTIRFSQQELLAWIQDKNVPGDTSH